MSNEETPVEYQVARIEIGEDRFHCFICAHLPVHAVQPRLALDIQCIIEDTLAGAFNASKELRRWFTRNRLCAEISTRFMPRDMFRINLGVCHEHLPNAKLLGCGITVGHVLTEGMLVDCIPERKTP